MYTTCNNLVKSNINIFFLSATAWSTFNIKSGLLWQLHIYIMYNIVQYTYTSTRDGVVTWSTVSWISKPIDVISLSVDRQIHLYKHQWCTHANDALRERWSLFYRLTHGSVRFPVVWDFFLCVAWFAICVGCDYKWLTPMPWIVFFKGSSKTPDRIKGYLKVCYTTLHKELCRTVFVW